jgi:hypothetical protein
MVELVFICLSSAATNLRQTALLCANLAVPRGCASAGNDSLDVGHWPQPDVPAFGAMSCESRRKCAGAVKAHCKQISGRPVVAAQAKRYGVQKVPVALQR